MKVRNRKSGVVVEATKNEDGSYTVEGNTVSKEDMPKTYMVVKEKPKEPKPEGGLKIVSGEHFIEGNIGALAGALAKAQGEFSSVKKGTEGHGYSYADIEAVLKASNPITSKYGLAITQMNLSKQVGAETLIGVRTILMHKDGGYVSSDIYTPIAKTKMNSLIQMAGVNITYLRRYGIQSALGLATTDNDGSDD